MILFLVLFPFSLPPLPYAYDALEPHIDTQTMKVHHTGHHQAYVDKLNAALKDHPELHKKPLAQMLSSLDSVPADIRTQVRNQGGGHYNHSFFWPLMKPKGGGQPQGELAQAINKKWATFDKFKEEFNIAATKVFGSGWAWLAVEPQGSLVIISTANQDTPLEKGLEPVIGLDVWEHAYYLKYQNKRPNYIEAWWNVINWEQAEKNYQQARGKP